MAYHFKALKVTLGDNVRQLRAKRDLSQEALADLAALDRTYISQIERATGNPSLEVIGKIAYALGVTPGSLIDKKY
jgi:transcriptional regulator with XRE-family HTH domain